MAPLIAMLLAKCEPIDVYDALNHRHFSVTKEFVNTVTFQRKKKDGKGH